MTKNPFDQFSKQFFETFLSPYGQIKISEEVPGEPTLIDIYFSPTVKPTQIPQSLGLLRRIAATPCLLEPYRNQPTIEEDIESCTNKLFAVRAEHIRELKRNDKAYSDQESPKLWIIAPSLSEKILKHYGAKPRSNWVNGIYFSSKGYHTRFVSVNKLPKIPETMWLRLFGRGAVQGKAVNEVLNLEENDSQRSRGTASIIDLAY